MPIQINYEYSSKIAKGLKNKVRRDILQSIQSSKEMRAEINRVLHMANRRAQNVEKAGYLSPAVASLEKSGFTKFSLKGLNWEQAKAEYGRAVAFLNQPTSSASGAKEFERQMRNGLGLDVDDTQWELMKHDLARGFNDSIDGILSRIPYAELMQEVYERAEISARNQMERDSYLAADNLNNSVQNATDKIANPIEDWLNGFHMI